MSQETFRRRRRPALPAGGGRRAPARNALAWAIAVAFALAGCSSAASSSHPASGATKAPIPLGYVNDESGPLAFPQFTSGVTAAVAYVNAHGGVNGAPIKLSQCGTDGSTAASLNCANQVVGDHVIGVLEGEDTGIDAMIPVLNAARLPTLDMAILGTESLTNSNNFLFSPAGTATDVADYEVLHNLGVKRVGYIGPQLPTLPTRFNSVDVPLAKSLGMQTNLISYSLSSPDYTSAVQAAVAAGDNGLVDLSEEAGCTAMETAVAALHFKGPVVQESCVQYAQTLGAKANGALSFTFNWLPSDSAAAPALDRSELGIYVRSLAAAGNSSLANNTSTIQGFALVMNAAGILRTIHGTPTSTTFTAALRSLKNFKTFLGASATCDPRPVAGQAACTNGLLVYQVKKGKLVLDGNGFQTFESK
jgi:branched-chain amino acid transport system substrate-binding protein